MKPINTDESGCTPISSNCVIWQGPDIECIKLCKGDTVSDVVYKLALELCEIMDTLNITNYDLTCLNLGSCEPKDFQELIQLLIDKICECCDLTPTAEQKAAGCPDCEVPIAKTFYYVNPQGDTVKTMQLDDYAQAVGNKVNDIVGEISTIDATLGNHETRIVSLESAPAPTLNLPQIIPNCVLASVPTDLDTVVDSLEAQFCELRSATGQPNEIFAALTKTPNGLAGSDQLAGSGEMNALIGWSSQISSLADSFNNMWLTIGDIRAAILSIKAALPSLCTDVSIILTATISGATLKLFFNGSIPLNYSECNLGGTSVRIEDTSGNFINSIVPLGTYLNNQAGFTVDLSGTPVSITEDLSMTASYCFTDGNNQCESIGSYTLINTSACPTVSLTPSITSILYQFNWLLGAATFQVKLYDATGVALLASNGESLGSPGTISNSFTGLTSDTSYRVIVEVTVDGVTTVCPFNITTTLPEPCIPPAGITAIITIP
jgi:hypothetical protein